jgi:hypothetical protein
LFFSIIDIEGEEVQDEEEESKKPLCLEQHEETVTLYTCMMNSMPLFSIIYRSEGNSGFHGNK